MSSEKLKLLLTELEAEVLHEALELYLQTQAVPVDRRFEYRYRAVRTVLESLRQATREVGTLPRGDDDEGGVIDDERSELRPFRERVED